MTITPDPLAAVPPVRGGEKGRTSVPGLDATARDLRWSAHILRGTAVALGALAWLALSWLNVAALDRTAWPIPLAMAAILLWWITGVGGWGARGVTMGAAMGAVVERGLDTWRALPEDYRLRSRRVAAALLNAGARHDIDGVRTRLALLDRIAQAAQARQLRDDVDELDAWLDASDDLGGHR